MVVVVIELLADVGSPLLEPVLAVLVMVLPSGREQSTLTTNVNCWGEFLLKLPDNDQIIVPVAPIAGVEAVQAEG